ncbi:MAG: TlyA family RNA methyltransferase [Chloroflexota bacterium]|nr:MAG: TlyA family RNA methyltransferase [Chloroflexota bacterium]
MPGVNRTAVRASRRRLDQLVVDRGLAESRARAQALILGGKVRTGLGDAARLDRKVGDLVDENLDVELVEREPWVSRGGHKLAAALDAFGIDPAARTCLDVGASTGGFTDVLLQRGARRVYALDVGRGQLAEQLRNDPRVVSMERTNARTITANALPEPVSVATIDVSFISLRLVLGPVASAFGPSGAGDIVALVKPQFEAGRAQVKGGVVRDPAVHRSTIDAVVAAARDLGLAQVDVIASPILGPEGNREFLLHLRVGSAPVACADLDAHIGAAVGGETHAQTDADGGGAAGAGAAKGESEPGAPTTWHPPTAARA